MKTKDYLKKLTQIIERAEITDGNNDLVEFQEGVELITQTITKVRGNKKVILIGNGGSAAIAEHGALDLWKNARIRAVSFNDGVLLTSISNDYGYSNVFEKPIEMFADSGDILIALSSSGMSENILKAAKKMKEIGCVVITMSGFKSENTLRTLGDANIYVPSDKYGFVEVAHQTILHMLTDFLMEEN